MSGDVLSLDKIKCYFIIKSIIMQYPINEPSPRPYKSGASERGAEDCQTAAPVAAASSKTLTYSMIRGT